MAETDDPVSRWLFSQGYVRDHDGINICIAWPMRSGYDYTDLEFNPLGDGRWNAIIGHHASGTNPRLIIGTCDDLSDVQDVHALIQRLNGYPGPELDLPAANVEHRKGTTS